MNEIKWFFLWIAYICLIVNNVLVRSNNRYFIIICILILVIIYLKYISLSSVGLKKVKVKYKMLIYIGQIAYIVLQMIFSIMNYGNYGIVDLRILVVSMIFLMPSFIYYSLDKGKN